MLYIVSDGTLYSRPCRLSWGVIGWLFRGGYSPLHMPPPPQRSLTRFLKGFTIVTVSICPFVILQDDTQDINLSHSRCRLSTQYFICHFVLVPPWPCCTLLTFFTLWNRLHTRQLIQQGLKSYCVSYGLLATIRYVPVTLSTVSVEKQVVFILVELN